ncbi:MAG: phosphoesterase [Leptothrix sp. (in: Bacteria)]|nr:phosphoesterase [Leptothrix sp. (in: b-proteobacteria)]
MTTLHGRMARGAAWLVMFRLVERGIGLISTLILVRLLVPDDFGLIAMATSILAALELMGAFSFDLALIQNQSATRKHYDTAWTFDVLFGLLKAAGMCMAAAPAALFFSEPRVEAVMYALAVVTGIQGFENVGVIAFQKDLELHKEFWFGLWKKLAGFAVTMVVAFALQSYWALIAGSLATRLTSIALSYRMHPYRPRFSMAAAGELFNYSKWLLLNNVLIFLNNRGTDFIIGRFSGARALGLYSVSFELANLPTTELVWPIQRAVFPGYAKLADDPRALREAFVKVIGLVALLTVPAGALVGAAAEPIVGVLLGAKWSGAAALVEVLAVFGIVRSLHGPIGSLYLAVGRPQFVAALQCVQLVIALSFMLILVPNHGAIGAAWSILAGATVAMTINYITAIRLLKMAPWPLVRVLWRPLSGALSMFVAITWLSQEWPLAAENAASVLRLAAFLALGLVTFVGVVAALWVLRPDRDGAETQLWAMIKSRGLRSQQTADPRA